MLQARSKYGIFILWVVILLLVFALGCGWVQIGGASMTIGELYSLCKGEGLKKGKYACEGKKVTIYGYLDFINVFDKKHYPNLSYQKFRLIDGPGILEAPNPWQSYTESIEVFVVGKSGDRLFEKLSDVEGLPLRRIVVKGVIRGFNAYTNRGFTRGIYLEARPEDVELQ